MSVGLLHVWLIDFIANIIVLFISIYLVNKVQRIRAMRPHTPLFMYLHWQIVALAVFAMSHSVGHIIRRVLILEGREDIWNPISPVTGGINSLTFIIVAVLSFLFKDIESASERLTTLRDAKFELEESLNRLRQTSIQIEMDAQEIFLKNRELTVLNKIAAAVSASMAIDRVLPSITREIKEFLGVELLAIYLVSGERIILKVGEGLSEELTAQVRERATDEHWLKRKVMLGKPFFASEPVDIKRGRIYGALKKEGIQTWAAVPLMSKGNVVGVLTAGSKTLDGINRRQTDTLMTVGGYAGVVIENSMLYEDLKQKLEDLERFRKFAVGREMRIIELKEQLKDDCGRPLQ